MSRTYTLDGSGDFVKDRTAPNNAINPYGQQYGASIQPAAPMTEAQGNAILLMMTRQCEMLKSIERSLVILNRMMP